MPKVAFYLAPPIDKSGLPPMVKTSKHYVELLKICFTSASTPTRGWFITTSYDREDTSKSYPRPPPGGGRLLPGCGACGVGRSPDPDCPPSGRAAGANYPLAVGAGGCGRGDPAPTPQRALLRAGFAHCGGVMRVPGGAPFAWSWGVRGWALSRPRLPALWAGCRGPLPTGCGCGGVRGWGPVTNPTARALASWLCALWGLHEGARRGASCLGVGRPGSGALPPLTARPLGGLPGPTTHWLWVRGGAGVGTHHKPDSARSCELALRASEAG